MKYPEFSVPGVPHDQTWQLFNTSNFEYYCDKVRGLREGTCPFCVIDPKINEVLPIPNPSWLAWENRVAAKANQSLQLIIATKEHFEKLEELGGREWSDLGLFILVLSGHYKLEGFSLLCRSGNALFNARSVPHIHFNLHVPDGTGKVAPTIGKSWADLEEKLKILKAFEKMRVEIEASGPSGCDVDEAFAAVLSREERELVRNILRKKAAG